MYKCFIRPALAVSVTLCLIFIFNSIDRYLVDSEFYDAWSRGAFVVIVFLYFGVLAYSYFLTYVYAKNIAPILKDGFFGRGLVSLCCFSIGLFPAFYLARAAYTILDEAVSSDCIDVSNLLCQYDGEIKAAVIVFVTLFFPSFFALVLSCGVPRLRNTKFRG